MASIAVLAWVAICSAILRMHESHQFTGYVFGLCQVSCLASCLIEVGAMDEGTKPTRIVYVTRLTAIIAFIIQVWMAAVTRS